MIESALRAYLIEVGSGVRDIVTTRVYPLLAPQNAAPPLIVYQKVGADRPVLSCGQANLSATSMQIDSYAKTYEGSKDLAEAVRDRIVNFNGTMGTVSVRRILLTTELDLLDVEPGLYRVSQTYTIWHLE